jgi:hypothetical protein
MRRHGFEMHDVFCSAPGNLGEELESFHRIVGEVNEAVGMPHKTLLAPLCLKSNNLILIAADPAKDNIRYCSFFVQVLKDSWGPVGLFRELYDVAAECRRDEQAPMREIAVFVKPPGSVEIPGDSPVHRYDTLASFESQLRTVLTRWLSGVLASTPSESPSPR